MNHWPIYYLEDETMDDRCAHIHLLSRRLGPPNIVICFFSHHLLGTHTDTDGTVTGVRGNTCRVWDSTGLLPPAVSASSHLFSWPVRMKLVCDRRTAVLLRCA